MQTSAKDTITLFLEFDYHHRHLRLNPKQNNKILINKLLVFAKILYIM